MNLQSLTVYKCPYEKKRLGKDNDGGYIICILPCKYNILLGCGISNDISFEEDFCNNYQDIECFAFDGTIDDITTNNNRIHFIKKNITQYNTETTTNLIEYIDKYENIFLKMDIEGAEIEWFQRLSTEKINKFAQMVIEFHYPFTEREQIVFDKINESHILVHFHGNNFADIRLHNGIIVPNVFECTYIHKKFYTEPMVLNTETIPCNIDMPNNPNLNDISLNFPPFVSE